MPHCWENTQLGSRRLSHEGVYSTETPRLQLRRLMMLVFLRSITHILVKTGGAHKSLDRLERG